MFISLSRTISFPSSRFLSLLSLTTMAPIFSQANNTGSIRPPHPPKPWFGLAFVGSACVLPFPLAPRPAARLTLPHLVDWINAYDNWFGRRSLKPQESAPFSQPMRYLRVGKVKSQSSPCDVRAPGVQYSSARTFYPSGACPLCWSLSVIMIELKRPSFRFIRSCTRCRQPNVIFCIETVLYAGTGFADSPHVYASYMTHLLSSLSKPPKPSRSKFPSPPHDRSSVISIPSSPKTKTTTIGRMGNPHKGTDTMFRIHTMRHL